MWISMEKRNLGHRSLKKGKLVKLYSSQEDKQMQHERKKSIQQYFDLGKEQTNMQMNRVVTNSPETEKNSISAGKRISTTSDRGLTQHFC